MLLSMQCEYTLEDYYALPDERRVELIDAVIKSGKIDLNPISIALFTTPPIIVFKNSFCSISTLKLLFIPF